MDRYALVVDAGQSAPDSCGISTRRWHPYHSYRSGNHCRRSHQAIRKIGRQLVSAMLEKRIDELAINLP